MQRHVNLSHRWAATIFNRPLHSTGLRGRLSGSVLTMRIAISYLILTLALGAIPHALAFGYIAPEAIEAGVIECSGENLNSFLCARGIERKEISVSGKAVRRSGNTLRIHLEKKKVSFVDNPADGEDSTVYYSYLGLNRKLNSHILHVQYYEGGTYLVINRHSGRRAFPSGYPLASPDGKHFLSLSEDMFAGYSSNNVEIWQVRRGAFRRVVNHEPEWGPHRGNWASVRHALIEKQCYSQEEGHSTGLKSCGLAKFERSGSAWKLIE